MSQKILIISESIDVEDSSGSKANVALIRNLRKAGFELRVYHYTRREVQWDDIDCVSIEENRRSLLFLLSRTERYLRYIFKIRLNKTLERLFGFSFTLLNDRNSIITALRNSNDFKPDLVLTLSKGGSFRPHHALLGLPEFHDKWMAYIHDPYPMHWYPPPYPWFEPGYHQKEDFMKNVASRCTITAFPSKILMEWMGSKFEEFKKKGVVIPHQIDHENQPKASQLLAKDLVVKPEKFTVLHAGNLIQGREPFGLLEGFREFLSQSEEARQSAELVFIGGENYYSDILNEFEREVSQFKNSKEKLDFDTVQVLQHNASVNIILEAKSEISPFLPGKFPHCIAANKKILLLGPPNSESRRLLGFEYPYWSEIDDKRKITLLLSELFENWKKDKASMELNRPDLEEYLSVNQLSKTMDSIFQPKKEESHE
ncbi:UDP-glycosyltransferase [Gramella jeungdoensis]|uniref:UDP-glycosyltransferase n=1 Tax=Gramella jeungdoensis TaxID=708091 RepID=A0ABT0Z0F8_9FLAO|nr:UDP-glycosyltransferase [Gramella jeungdoensis]MCM8569212.1 UDP-glycosyltransferase [Gramella jeungdoensis]